MIDVSRVILNPKFSQVFSVLRQSGDFVRGRMVQSEEELRYRGVIKPAKAQEIEMIPEGDRVGGEIVIYATKKLYVTNESGTSDEVIWNGEKYKIYSVSPYSDYGYYKAIAIRKESC